VGIDTVLYGLSKSESPRDILTTWKNSDFDMSGFKAIVALDNYSKGAYPSNLIKYLKSGDTDFIPYFHSENLYFTDDQLLNEMFSSKENVEFPVDYSIMVDTNYASYIHQFIKSDYSDLDNTKFNTIALLIREEFRYDYWFYILENSKLVDFDKAFDLIEFKKAHSDMHANLVSLELFKSIDSDAFKNNEGIIYTISKSEAIERADYLIENLFCGEGGKEFFHQFSFLQKQMKLFLIGMLEINFKSGKSAKNKLVELFDYMNEVVGAYLDREIRISYEYFKKNSNLKIFNKIQRNGKIDGLSELLSNIAWDFVAPRAMEFFLRLDTEGRFFLPFFLSHDGGLKEVLNMYDAKAVLYSENIGPLTVSKIGSVEYFESEKCKIDLNYYFSPESLRRRADVLDKNRENIDSITQRKYEDLLSAISR
jgi:hypothetical protein